MSKPLLRLFVLASAAAALAVAVGACGGSSEPDYCSDVSELEGSVDELNDVELDRGAISTVRADLEEVRTEANAVVDSAKQDFPSETRALKSSVASLSSAIDQLPPAPTAQQVVALAAEVDGAVRSAQDLARATESACD